MADVTKALALFAVAAPGLEAVVAREVATLPGATKIVQVVGGVEFDGDAGTLVAANRWLRVATRVLVRVGRFKARDFARLVREAAALPWEQFAAVRPPVEVTTTARKSRLYHTGAIAERITAAVHDRLSCRAAAPADTAPLHVVARVEEDAFALSVDASGELLHRRGYREETAKAPLRETLAAGLLALAAWDPTTPLLDPMCGSGTIVLEAALLALGRAPGAQRTFACDSWPLVIDAAPALATRPPAAPPAAPRTALPAAIVGSDRDAGAVEIARRNAARAGLDTHVTFTCADAASAPLPAGPPGLIIANAPYGARVPPREAYVALGALWRRARGWRLAVLTSDPTLLRAIGGRPQAEHPLINGGIRVRLYCYGPATG